MNNYKLDEKEMCLCTWFKNCLIIYCFYQNIIDIETESFTVKGLKVIYYCLVNDILGPVPLYHVVH